ncbi:MAG TPA: acyltransferase [Solirubrobacteraceae bacterium]|nr:acyltransferase [Solirubrobacteraceae bacterium]
MAELSPRQILWERLRAAPSQLRAAGSLRVWLLYLPGPGPMLASWLRKRWVIWRNPHATIRFLGAAYLGPGFSLDMPRGGTLIVGHGVEFRRGFRAEFGGPDAVIRIGELAVFTYDVVLQCSSSIEIGAHVQFGQATLVVDGNHRFRSLDLPMLSQGYEFTPLRLADHATITTKCTILADIGERTFIGANSVVSRPLPAFCVAAGAPARVLEYFGPPGQEPPELATAERS